MKATAFAVAMLLSGTAIAQTTPDAGTMTDTDTTAETTTSSTTMDTTGQTEADMQNSSDVAVDTSSSMDNGMQTAADATTATSQSSTAMASNMQPASGAVVQPGNSSPEKDARGVTVMSDPASVPAGWNGVTGSGVGGPLVDPATGATVAADADYPACSASVTDNCVQTYERGRS